jgi:hypothetical protein
VNNKDELVGLILPSALSEYKGPTSVVAQTINTAPVARAFRRSGGGNPGVQQDSTNAGEICEIGLCTGQVEWRCHPVTKIPKAGRSFIMH